MNNLKYFHFFKSYQKPNFLFIFISCLYFLNNSIFSINENISIYIYIIIFLVYGSIDYKFSIYKIHFSKKNLLYFFLLILPSFLFLLSRFKVGISFRGDEIAHYSNSLSNLSYWFVPQDKEGLENFINQPNFSILEILNIKIINLVILIIINLFSYLYFKKFFNLTLFISSLIVIYLQESFPYEYSQGGFFVDNFTQILIYFFLPFSFSESLGVTNFIFFLIYLLILRPLINNENPSIKDFKLYSFILIFPFFNILLFSNHQEGIAVIFVLLAVENFFKYENLKKSSLLLSIAGCFREIFFLAIIIFFIFDIIKNKKNYFQSIKFYLIIFSPLFFHMLHISNNEYGVDKIKFLSFKEINLFTNLDLNLLFLNLPKLLVILTSLFISIYLIYKKKLKKIIILSFLNVPIILLLFYRNSFSFLEIDRFFYLWIMIFYFYIFIYFSNLKFSNLFFIPLILIIFLNNFLFLKKFNNYNLNYENERNLFLPIKSVLKKSNNDQELYIVSDIQINKFNSDLYPNLNSIKFIDNFIDKEYCSCVQSKIFLFISKYSFYEDKLCNFENYLCKKEYLIQNKNYNVLLQKK